MNQATLSRVVSSAERVRLDPQRASDHIDRLFRAAWALCGSRQDAEDGLLAGKDGGGCRYRAIAPTDEYRPMALHRSCQCFHDICALRQFHIRLMTVRMEDIRDRPDHFIGIAIAQRATVLIENHADFQKVRLRLLPHTTNV